MSSNEEDYGDDPTSLKKRRIQRACDICRRKKIRCDGVQMPGNRCSNCIAYNFECSYIEAAKKRGPPKGYVEGLENRVHKLERLLQRLCPGEDFLEDIDSHFERDSWIVEKFATASRVNRSDALQVDRDRDNREITTALIRTGTEISPTHPQETELDDDFAHVMLADNLKKLSISKDAGDYRFFGKSSGAMLIQTAIELKQEYTGKQESLRQHLAVGSHRPEFWSLRPWEQAAAQLEHIQYTFPESDLMKSLIGHYFENVDIFLPLIHRPTFERSIEQGLHHTHEMFGATLLLVCAVGARFSSDVRVKLEGVEGYHSNGWEYFDQVQLIKKSLLDPPSLYDLQFYCLSVHFLQGCSAPQACWTMVGIGIRSAQDVGAHRRKAPRGPPTVEDEQWKRAFWVLVTMDRMVSAGLGRPCAIQDEDFDIDLPIECDDEYWEAATPEQCFKQPPGKPSRITAFNLLLKLNRILSFSLRTIYSINKSKILLGFVGPQWEQHIVAELDSALNKWVDNVPDFLRWDPTRENELFFNQSVLLYTCYYNIQILIHRPFIPSPKKPSPLSFPSLAICTNAARSSSHIVDIQRKRSKMLIPQLQMFVFTAGIVLLLNIWGGKRSGLSTDPSKEMADVHKCMGFLRALEHRWQASGRLWDMLYELASVGELPLPQPSPPSVFKRERGSDSPQSSTQGSSPPPQSHNSDGLRSIAGNRRVGMCSQAQPQSWMPLEQRQHRPSQGDSSMYEQPTPVSPQVTQPSAQGRHQHQRPASHSHHFTLPVYSDELGSIPLHGQVQFSMQGQAPLSAPVSDYWYESISSMTENPSSPAGPASTSATMTSPGSGIHNLGATSAYPSELDAITAAYSSMDGVYPTMTSRNYQPYGLQVQQESSQSLAHPHPHSRAHHQAAHSISSVQSGVQSGQRGQAANQVAAAAAASQMFSMGAQVGRGMGGNGNQALMENETIAMWSNAPTGFELDDWGTYLTNVSELAQAFNPNPTNGASR